MRCVSTNAAHFFDHTFTVEQTAVDCSGALTETSHTSPVVQAYTEGGTGLAYDQTFFFTNNNIPGCTVVCDNGGRGEYEDTCGSGLNS